MTYGYIRVSSDRQTVENQRYEMGRIYFQNGRKSVELAGLNDKIKKSSISLAYIKFFSYLCSEI